MALRNILKDDDKGLLKISRAVTDFNKRLHILIDDMRETLISENGMGLAAPQVGVLRRVVLIVDVSTEAESLDEKIVELVNPELVCTEGEQECSEGCLSLPGLFGMVKRPQTVRVKAQDRYGKAFELEASELTARAICHEIDHLNGILFTSIAERMLTEEEIEEMRESEEENE